MQKHINDAARRTALENTLVPLRQTSQRNISVPRCVFLLHTLRVSIFAFLANERYVAAPLGLLGFYPLNRYWGLPRNTSRLRE